MCSLSVGTCCRIYMLNDTPPCHDCGLCCSLSVCGSVPNSSMLLRRLLRGLALSAVGCVSPLLPPPQAVEALALRCNLLVRAVERHHISGSEAGAADSAGAVRHLPCSSSCCWVRSQVIVPLIRGHMQSMQAH